MKLADKTIQQLEKMKLRKEREKSEKLRQKAHHDAIMAEAMDLDEMDEAEAKVKRARTNFHSFIKSKLDRRLQELDIELLDIGKEIVKKTK